MRNSSIFLSFTLSLSLLSTHSVQANEPPTQTIFPEAFKVYYKDNMGVSRKDFHGSTEKTIPTKNEFTAHPGCYLSCVSHNKKDGIYTVGDGKYVVGQLRVKGHYANGLCIPSGYESKDIRNANEWKEKCQASFPEMCPKGSCKVMGNTANWFF